LTNTQLKVFRYGQEPTLGGRTFQGSHLIRLRCCTNLGCHACHKQTLHLILPFRENQKSLDRLTNVSYTLNILRLEFTIVINYLHGGLFFKCVALVNYAFPRRTNCNRKGMLRIEVYLYDCKSHFYGPKQCSQYKPLVYVDYFFLLF